jgi:dGTPase
LIHDLGNPPFGHAGELAISDWFKKQLEHDESFFEIFSTSDKDKRGVETQFAQDFLRFEGNAQTQRLLSRLQVLADDFGLNLTCGTLSASCKYIAQSDTTQKEGNQPRKKHGYFASENGLIEKIRKEVGTADSRNPIAFLIEASDDIAYATVDLEDGIKKACISWDFLERELRHRCGSAILEQILKKAHDKIDPAKLSGRSLDEAMSVAFRTFAIVEMSVATSKHFKEQYESIMTGTYVQELLYQSEGGQVAKACKAIAFEHVYSAPEVLKREIMGREIIFDLLDLYWEAAKAWTPEPKKFDGFNKKVYSQISSNYRKIFERNISNASNIGIPESYFRMQLVTDQIAGMTDSFAVRLHRELKNA